MLPDLFGAISFMNAILVESAHKVIGNQNIAKVSQEMHKEQFEPGRERMLI